MIADQGEVNEQEEIMEKLHENGNVADKGTSWIKEGRLDILKKKYKKPYIDELVSADTSNIDCSDMASIASHMCSASCEAA